VSGPGALRRGAAFFAAAFPATGAFAATVLVGGAFFVAAFFAGAASAAPAFSAVTAAVSASTWRRRSATSFAVGTPSRPSAFAVRSSNRFSSRSHDVPALLPTSAAIELILPPTSPSFSSATACVLRCRPMPSLTSASNTLPPSAWALANAPMPASQICCADSLTELASWLSSMPSGSDGMPGAFFGGLVDMG